MLRIKLAKIVSICFFIAAVAAALIDNHTTAKAYSSGPPSGHTGAPGELTCATSGCHTGTANTGGGEFFVEAPSVYAPGQTYQIVVRHASTASSRRRWGFQLTVLDGTNAKAGDLASVNGFTQIVSGGPGGNRQYAEHEERGTFPGQTGGATWTFNWTAPSSDIGPVTFSAAGNQANNDGVNSGDQIYTVEATIFSGAPEITDASVSGKKLRVSGRNFADGAALFMCECENPVTGGSRVKKVSNNADDPFGLLVAKKAGRDIQPGSTVYLQVQNDDNTFSNVFKFTRPL